MQPASLSESSSDRTFADGNHADVTAFVWGVLVMSFSHIFSLVKTDRKYQPGMVNTWYAVFMPAGQMEYDQRQGMVIRVRKLDHSPLEVDIDPRRMKHAWSYNGNAVYDYSVRSPACRTKTILSLVELHEFVREFNAGIPVT